MKAPDKLLKVEEAALEHLAEEAPLEEHDPARAALEDWEQEPPLPPLRVGLVMAAPTLAAAIMIGSIFEGIAGKVYPGIAGLVGIAIAAQASRRKSALVVNLTIAFGLFATGVLLVLPAGVDNVGRLVGILREARESSGVLRPPAEFLPGFRLIVGWLMGSVGFAAGWIAIEMRRPGLGLLAPLPLVAMGAISVPDSAKLGAGLAALVLFIIGLALHASLHNISSGEGDAPGLAYEMRRALRAVPLIGVLVGLMVVLTRTSLLFPPPLYDPVREAQRPKPIPLSEVEDRVLFEVKSASTGPWRLGILDVYDGTDWRLPAFAESELERVPTSGLVDESLQPGFAAEFLVKGLGGAVLPGVPNTVGIIAEGPLLAYDPRTGNIRLAEGQIRDGLTYTVTAAAVPTEEQLRAVEFVVDPDHERFLDMPPAPGPVQSLLDEAPAEPMWDRIEFVRRRFLETVVASGAGLPGPVPSERVADMLAGSKEGTPFEIVAAQVMLVRWAGVPARIAYGFDGGEELSPDVRSIRPRHGASWLEMSFPGYGWFPVIGNPLKAKASLTSEGPTNPDAAVEPSDDIGVEVWIPLRSEESSRFYEQTQRIVAVAAIAAAILALVYFTFPAQWKARRRARRRRWAHAAGPIARVQVAYAELRDYCTDLGVGDTHSTPLGFLDHFVQDDEHDELAWLMTRTLWGDLRDAADEEDARAAEELASTLRRRLAQTQPATLRFVAAVSRRSVRDGYAADVAPDAVPDERARAVEAVEEDEHARV